MKKLFTSFFLFMIINLAFCSYSCGQNGPTPASVTLSFTQCIPATGNVVAINNVYKAVGSGIPAPPAVYTSTAPITSWSDVSVVRGNQYSYAVTCTDNKGSESGYSNVVSLTIPTTPGGITPPVQNTPKEAKYSPKRAPNVLTGVF